MGDIKKPPISHSEYNRIVNSNMFQGKKKEKKKRIRSNRMKMRKKGTQRKPYFVRF